MLYDLVILGAGPAGLTAGIYASSRKLKAVIIEADEAGGQLMSIYPGKGIANYPGIEMLEGKDLAERLIKHSCATGCELNLKERALEIADSGDHLTVKSEKGVYDTKAVIIAIGAGLYKPKRLGAIGEEKFEGKGVLYRLPDKEELKGKNILFVGGGNSALEMALMACDVAEVCLVHRREAFRADACFVERIEEAKVKTYMCSELEEIKGKDHVESVVLKTQDKVEEVPMDMVIINIGFAPEDEDLSRFGVNLLDGQITVDSEMMTSRKGVYACGDIVAYPGKFKQIVTACGEAATAANSAYKYVSKPYWA